MSCHLHWKLKKKEKRKRKKKEKKRKRLTTAGRHTLSVNPQPQQGTCPQSGVMRGRAGREKIGDGLFFNLNTLLLECFGPGVSKKG